MPGIDRIFLFEDFKLTTSPLRLHRAGVPLELSLQPLKLLELLIERRDTLLTHAAIREHLWQGKRVEFGRSIHACVHQLRVALGDPADHPRYIENIPGQGYRFVARVRSPTDRQWQRRFAAVAGAVVILATLAAGLTLGQRPPGPSIPVDEARMRDHYQRGLYLLDEESPHTARSALSHFDAALALDPRFGPANLGAARALEQLGRYEEARRRAHRALRVEASRAGAHVALGRIALSHDWNWSAARDHFAAAVELDPASAEAYQGLATHDILTGSFASGLALMDRARAVDPVSTLIKADYGWFHYYAGNLETATQLCGEAAELAPAVLTYRHCLVYVLSEKGDVGGASDQVRASMEIQGAEAEQIAAVIQAYAERGVVAYHRWRLQRFRAGKLQRELSPARVAFLCAAVGDVECTLAHLERAYEVRDHLLPFVAVSPRFRSLAGESRFQALLDKLGLRRYERTAMS